MLLLGIILLVIAALLQFAVWSLVSTLVVVGAALVVFALVLGDRSLR